MTILELSEQYRAAARLFRDRRQELEREPGLSRLTDVQRYLMEERLKTLRIIEKELNAAALEMERYYIGRGKNSGGSSA